MFIWYLEALYRSTHIADELGTITFERLGKVWNGETKAVRISIAFGDYLLLDPKGVGSAGCTCFMLKHIHSVLPACGWLIRDSMVARVLSRVSLEWLFRRILRLSNP